MFTALVVWFARSIHDFLLPPADTITVPSFVGQTLTDADAEIANLKLASAVIDRVTSDRYPKGVVVMQRPDAGTDVRQGRQISFVVSDGIVARLMPDLRYQSMREVSLDLARAKLQLGKVTYAKSEVIPEGHVISQDPAPLSNVDEGDVVTLVVSKGGLTQLRVPNFVGTNVDQARALADKMGIKLGQIVWTPLGREGPAHGTIARQLPAAGTKISTFDQVSLQASAGPYESGYIIRQARVLASVPVPEGETASANQLDVRLTVTDATGHYDLYHAFAEPGQKLAFTVTAVGTSVVDMYVNGVLVGETRLGSEPPAIYDMKPSPSPSP
ncbi:MAG TPA: PASTA domain-containing protein [Verrucomicrobiae bacterium]|nr:PASTA domain-containing protein [Verrucomicrobiae bacterium]